MADALPAVDPQPELLNSLGTIYATLTPPLRRQLYRLIALMLVGALTELIALGAVLPFLTILADPDRAYGLPMLSSVFNFVGAATGREFVIVSAAVFGAAAIIAGAARLWLAWVNQAFVFNVAHYLGVDIHRRMLYQPYSFHVAQNTSETIAALEKVQVILFNVLIPIMQGVSSTVIALFIVAVLVYVDPVAALIAGVAFSTAYILVSALSRRRLQACSETINSAYKLRVQAVQESLGGIRDIIIDHSQAVYIEQFEKIDERFRRAQALAAFIGAGPRFAIEAAGMVLISILAVLLSGRHGGIVGALPVLGALALGAQRLLPLLQQIYYGWSSLESGRAMLGSLIPLLHLPAPERQADSEMVDPLSFEREIRIAHVSFWYPSHAEAILSNIDFTIQKGSSVALIGETGSGKSTLTDLIMGLLEPQEGRIIVDGVTLNREARPRWQAQIAHVPQAIYLADTTIERNIAFGAPEAQIDHGRVVAAARQAQLHDFIETLPDGYRSSVGERGVRLSGGQRQRLGIARALYKQANVLILDEATSALDSVTEAAVMRSLRGVGKALTVIMIAHRLPTVSSCDQIVRLKHGQIAQIGSYEEVVAAVAPLHQPN